jgi:hypothetical protein
LVFSNSWADELWYNSLMLWILLIGATAIVLISIIPHYGYSKKPSQYKKWLGFLLPLVGAVYLDFCIWFLWAIDWMVQNTLLGFGLVYSASWSSVYYTFSTISFVLMVLSLVILVVLSFITLRLLKLRLFLRRINFILP